MATDRELQFDTSMDELRDSISEIRGITSRLIMYSTHSPEDARRIHKNISNIDLHVDILSELHRNPGAKE